MFFALFSCGYSQVQNGLVREHNSGKSPIGGVQITFNDAVPTTSDDAGNFRLAFKGKKAGDLIFYSEISKTDYELVNGKDLEVLKVSSSDRLIEDIILAKAGLLEAAKKEYYSISDKALLEGFKKEKKALQDQLQQAKISQNQCEERLKTLQEQYDNQKQALDALADKFSRVNFDDQEPLYREALELFKAGRISETQKKLEAANLLERADKRIKERDRIKNEEAENDKGIQQDIRSIQLLFQTYLLEFKYDASERYVDKLFQLDSTNLEILQETADFYQQIQSYTRAMRSFNSIIFHPQVEDWRKANAYSHLGELYTIIGNLPDAMKAFLQFQNMYATLHMQNLNNSFYKNNLAISYQYIGITHTSLGNLEKALTYFEDYMKLEKELYDSYPQNVDFKNGLAISYSKLAVFYRDKKNDNKTAIAWFQKAAKLWSQLATDFPSYKEFGNNLRWVTDQIKEAE